MLNSEKTEIILFGTPQQLKKVNITKINICEAAIYPADVVKDLGVWFDSSLTMTTHINKTSASAFFYLYNIRHIRKFLSRQHTEILIHAFISSRLDYCNSLLYGLPDSSIHKLKRIQNAPKLFHITPLLMELHWLPVRQRIAFKLLLITYKSLNQMAPIYLSDLIFIAQAGRYNLRSSNRGLLLAHPRIRSKKTLTDRSFMLAAPNLWNKLPAEICSSPTLNIF